MIILFYLGWLLLVLAFVAAASESLMTISPLMSLIWVSAYDLWHTIWPTGPVILQIRLERYAPFLWDPIVKNLLMLPAWLLFGLPGALLAWYCRPGRVLSPEQEEAFKKHEQSLKLYDALAEQAHRERDPEEGHVDDREPDHSGHDALDDLVENPLLSDDQLLKSMEQDNKPD